MAADKETKKPTETHKRQATPPYGEWHEGMKIKIGTCGYSRYHPLETGKKHAKANCRLIRTHLPWWKSTAPCYKHLHVRQHGDVCQCK
jgi:hypothetical protein